MPTVDVTINGRRHSLQCGAGEEIRLKRLAAYVDGRVQELSKLHGQVGDTRMLVLVSLLIADELSDAYEEVKKLRARGSAAEAEGGAAAIAAVERVAQRLEELAEALERT